jgi:trans-2,3-dihydro-3-hydroxyanthranilate isomerase
MTGPRLTVLNSCTRNGRGGSPTAVVIDNATLTDDERRAIARTAGTSHTAFIDTCTSDTPAVRFFTTAGELNNCGHGTLAAQAALLHRSDATSHHGHQRTGNRTFATTAVRRRAGIEVWLDQGIIALQDCTEAASHDIITALGLRSGDIADDLRIASPGTPRLLIPIRERRTLQSMRPDFGRLTAQCRRLGYLGCFAYALSPTATTAVARMFAPAIGVDEDIVNANSAGCLAAHLLDTCRNNNIEIHQGDALGHPSTVFATATHTPDGIATRIGGLVHVSPDRTAPSVRNVAQPNQSPPGTQR